MIRLLLADDEPIALERLELAARGIAEAVVVATARNGRQAVELLRECRPDIAVLDIQMPGKDGFGVIEAIQCDAFVPEIIFATAFHHHAVRAFEIHAVDYLLKPIEFDRFREAVRRAKARLEARSAEARLAELQQLVGTLRGTGAGSAETDYLQDLWVRTRSGLVRVLCDEVDLITAEGDYVLFHVGANQYLHKDTMASLQARLEPGKFQRIHRSAIVNLTRIAGVRRRGRRSLSLLLPPNREVAVGPSFVDAALDALHAKRWR